MIAYLLIIAVAFTVVAVSLVRLVGDYLFNQQMKDDQRVAQNIAAALAERDRLEADLHREELARDEAARQTGRLEEQLAAAIRDHDTYTQAILRLRDSDEVRALEGLRGQLDRRGAHRARRSVDEDRCTRPERRLLQEAAGGQPV